MRIIRIRKYFLSGFFKKFFSWSKNLDITDIFIDSLENLIKILQNDKKISIYTKNDSTLETFLEYNNIQNISLHKTQLNILKSFQSPTEIIICDDNLSKIFVKKSKKITQSKSWFALTNQALRLCCPYWSWYLSIWRNCPKELGKSKEYLEIHYKNNDKLFVPITETTRISKYIGN